jgi:hypothetical protein
MCVPGWPTAFRGSAAVDAGLVTWAVLHGPRFRRLYPDTYVATGPRPLDLTLRSHAALQYVEGRGVFAGCTAAELLGASCAPANAPVELIVPHRGQRGAEGLRLRRERLMTDEIDEIDEVLGLPVTTPPRTAFDLARSGELDLAYPEHMIGIEYDGGVHTRAGAVLRDIGRHTSLLDQGWRVYRYTKLDVLHRPDRIVTQLRRALHPSRSTW